MSRVTDALRTERERSDSSRSNRLATRAPRIARRRLLGTVGAITLSGTAGCLGWFGDDEVATPTPTPDASIGFGEEGYGAFGYGGIDE